MGAQTRMGHPESRGRRVRSGEVGEDEVGNFGDGGEGIGEEGGEDGEDVGIAIVDVEGGGDASGAGLLVEAVRVVEEGFFGADLDE